MLKSSLCDYSDSYILVKGTITFQDTSVQDPEANNTNKEVIFRNCASFTDYLREISNTLVDNAKNIDVVMLMYMLIQYSENYLNTIEILWK